MITDPPFHFERPAHCGTRFWASTTLALMLDALTSLTIFLHQTLSLRSPCRLPPLSSLIPSYFSLSNSFVLLTTLALVRSPSPASSRSPPPRPPSCRVQWPSVVR